MNLFKLFVYLNEKREGNRRLYYLKEIGNILNSDINVINNYQLYHLQNIINFSYNNIEFYRKRFDKCNVSPTDVKSTSDLIRFPVLEKDDIRNNLDSMLYKGLSKYNLIKTATGGTTASPVTLYVDRESWAKRRAATLFFYKWFNYEIGDKIAYLWGAEQDFSSNDSIKQSIRNALIDRSLCLQSSYLNDEIMRNHYDRLAKFKPNVLQAYPTPLFLFANFMKKYNLRLNIEIINVTAEYLYDYQREVIEDVFKTKIYNWYGARELGHVATECSEHFGMHINMSGLFIEVINNGKQVVGENGYLVITDLLNKAMPLIRYRIGDIGNISNRICKCGSALTILESIEGRYVDTFMKMDGSFIPGVAFTNRIISECKGIRELQIVQKNYKIFHLNIVKGEQYLEIDLEYLKQKISSFMHDNIDYEVSFVSKIPTEKSGKVRFCKSEMH